jgi:hypothetical protein
MLSLLLTLQLFLGSPFVSPITNAYAVQIKQDAVVSITYTDVLPLKVCTSAYELDDTDFRAPTATQCVTPEKGDIHNFAVWENTRIDFVNFEVVVYYPNETVRPIMHPSPCTVHAVHRSCLPS